MEQNIDKKVLLRLKVCAESHVKCGMTHSYAQAGHNAQEYAVALIIVQSVVSTVHRLQVTPV